MISKTFCWITVTGLLMSCPAPVFAQQSSPIEPNSTAAERAAVQRDREATNGQQPATTPPNILLLFADDLGYEALGCYGGEDYKTPRLDRLASQGMRFRRAYTSPVCTPSRMSLYTGTYVSRHGYYNVLPVHLGTKQSVDFKQRCRTFPQLLSQADYLTSVTGKWQLATLEYHPKHCLDAGFQSWCVWQIWRNGAKTTRYWEPCFNHDGVIRNDIADRFGPDVLAEYVVQQMKAAIAAQRPFYIQHNMLLPHWPISQTPDDRKRGQQASLGSMVQYLDQLCGRILDEVDQLGIADQTVVIFMGDNGTDEKQPRSTKAGPVSGGKSNFNDAGTHNPLLVRYPGVVKAGTVADDLVDMTDLFPTICELAGVELTENLQLDGISFASRLHGEPPAVQRAWVSGGYQDKLTLFDGSWRITTGSKNIVDARQLPIERVVQEVPTGSENEVQRLRDAAAKLRQAK